MSASSFPSWVASQSEKVLYGKALGLGADALVLSDHAICKGFVEGRESLQTGTNIF